MSSFSFAHRLQLAKEAIAKLPREERTQSRARLRLALWIMGPLMAVVPLVYLFTESVTDMIACHGRHLPPVSVTASELQTMPVGSHVLISNFEISVQSKMTSTGIHATRHNVPLYSPNPTSTSHRRSAFVTLSQETAGTAAVLGIHSKFTPSSHDKQISLPPLDAVIVSGDETTIRLVESTAAFTYSRILLNRAIAVSCVVMGMMIILLLIRQIAAARTSRVGDTGHVD